jgi:hypothetical protein
MAHDRLQCGIASMRLNYERRSVDSVFVVILREERIDCDLATLGARAPC